MSFLCKLLLPGHSITAAGNETKTTANLKTLLKILAYDFFLLNWNYLFDYKFKINFTSMISSIKLRERKFPSSEVLLAAMSIPFLTWCLRGWSANSVPIVGVESVDTLLLSHTFTQWLWFSGKNTVSLDFWNSNMIVICFFLAWGSYCSWKQLFIESIFFFL